MANTSTIWQQAVYTTYRLSSPSCCCFTVDDDGPLVSVVVPLVFTDEGMSVKIQGLTVTLVSACLIFFLLIFFYVVIFLIIYRFCG